MPQQDHPTFISQQCYRCHGVFPRVQLAHRDDEGYWWTTCVHCGWRQTVLFT